LGSKTPEEKFKYPKTWVSSSASVVFVSRLIKGFRWGGAAGEKGEIALVTAQKRRKNDPAWLSLCKKAGRMPKRREERIILKM
jgi:hypothetical protein